ncbi:hypothetical protein J19TS2_17410 [Cohnella xylanilytica]|uniref:hypothetical protein n=1 Tax=Cohnella xylanilytica TaxID=557555 RepID=UPI001B215E40|nr:hypothetical protein [Cohnella xylanilytica]GIO12186.1 hypothetical protein J19TS2_17410 [Cohnella xylanilytica]
MKGQTTVSKETHNEVTKRSSLIAHSTEEIKKDELIGVLAELIRNYAVKKANK